MSTKKGKMLAKEGLLEPALILDVDMNVLEDEWINQPKLFNYWAVELENAKADLDDAKRDFEVGKSEFELVKAEIDLDIRSHSEKYDELPKEAVEKNKVTEKMVASVLLMQRGYKEAQSDFFEFQKAIDITKHRVGVLQAMVKSLDQRKSGLEGLVDLHGQKYWSRPRASESSRDAMEEVEKQFVRRKVKKSKRSDHTTVRVRNR